jgi:hypothetical protein
MQMLTTTTLHSFSGRDNKEVDKRHNRVSAMEFNVSDDEDESSPDDEEGQECNSKLKSKSTLSVPKKNTHKKAVALLVRFFYIYNLFFHNCQYCFCY